MAKKDSKSKYSKGQKVIHPLHGIGVIEKIEEKFVLGETAKFQVISFNNNKLKIMLKLDQQNPLIRNLVGKDEIPRVLKFLKTCTNSLPRNSSERYNINLNKIKTSDIYKLAEVIKDLSDLSKIKKLSPKELSMFKQSKKMLSAEFSCVANVSQEEMDSLIEKCFK